MKVLWICGLIFPEVARKLNIKSSYAGGWLIGLSKGLVSNNNVELSICVPTNLVTDITKCELNGVKHYLVPSKDAFLDDQNYDLNLKFKKIKEMVKPDIVHAFGSEFAFSKIALKVFGSNCTVISIQGMPSVYAKHYYANLPNKIVKSKTIIDIITGNSIIRGKKDYIKRGEVEKKIIKDSKYIIGRTDWDEACVSQINSDAVYFHCNESLRDIFYLKEWDIHKCERHTIFMSQGNYPIKGLHMVLESLSILKLRFPKVKLNIAGIDIGKYGHGINKIKRGAYVKYIHYLIFKYKLERNVSFLGMLDEEKMCDNLLKSNVYVCPSSIENSPNSLGEAMLLGVPSIASFVGGIPSMISHEKEGFLYQFDAPYMLAHYISKIFNQDELALKISTEGRKRAQLTHDRKTNSKTLIDAYSAILRRDLDE